MKTTFGNVAKLHLKTIARIILFPHVLRKEIGEKSKKNKKK